MQIIKVLYMTIKLESGAQIVQKNHMACIFPRTTITGRFWPPRSPDMNASNYYLWKALKQPTDIFKEKIHTY